MAATKFAVVYGATSRIIRRIIVPDDDSYFKNFTAKPGEGMSLFLIGSTADMSVATLSQAVAQATGVAAAAVSPRCAEIDAQGNIVNVVMADPLIDAAQTTGHSLVQSDVMAVGGTFINGVYTAPVVKGVNPVTQGAPA